MAEEQNRRRKRFARLRIHYTWIAVIIFVTASVWTEFSTAHSLPQRLLLGLIAALLFLISAILRAYALVLVAASKGVPIKNFTVFAIGTVYNIEAADTTPSFESLMGVAGLLSNLIMGGLFFLAYEVLASTGSVMVQVVVQWLAFSWFMVSLLGFLPGLPMESGRIVGALVWKATKKYEWTTRFMGWIGWSFGVLMAVGGVVDFIMTREWFAAMLLILAGLIMQNAATHSRRLGKWVQEKLEI